MGNSLFTIHNYRRQIVDVSATSAWESLIMYDHLLTKIKNKSAKIGIIGLGYVGLPLGTSLAKCGYLVTGLDASQPRVDALNHGSS